MVVAVGTGDITVRSGFMQENANLSRLPKNDMEWSQFIRELARWRSEYEGTMDLTSIGFSGDPVTFADILYFRYGKIVIVKFPVQESTSDSALFQLQVIPARIRPAVSQNVPCMNLVDNGTATNGTCSIAVNGVLSFNLGSGSGGFTSSGDKGFGDIAPTIIYSLFDAARID